MIYKVNKTQLNTVIREFNWNVFWLYQKLLIDVHGQSDHHHGGIIKMYLFYLHGQTHYYTYKDSQTHNDVLTWTRSKNGTTCTVSHSHCHRHVAYRLTDPNRLLVYQFLRYLSFHLPMFLQYTTANHSTTMCIKIHKYFQIIK